MIGYCWGGSLSWRIACESSNLSASVCYYGGDIPKLRDLKPKCDILTHFGDLDKGIWSAGMIVGLIDDIPTCHELISRIVAEAEEIIKRRLIEAVS